MSRHHDTGGAREYRVSWKRDGVRRKTRTFMSLPSAEKHVRRLTVESDPHFRCDEGHGYYAGTGYHVAGDGNEQEWFSTCLPEIVEGPVIESRERVPWTPVP